MYVNNELKTNKFCTYAQLSNLIYDKIKMRKFASGYEKMLTLDKNKKLSECLGALLEIYHKLPRFKDRKKKKYHFRRNPNQKLAIKHWSNHKNNPVVIHSGHLFPM